MKTFYFENGAEGIIDFGLKSGETLTGMTSLGGKCYVLTNQRMFLLKPKSRFRLFIEKLFRERR